MTAYLNPLQSLQQVPSVQQPAQAAAPSNLRALLRPSPTIDGIRWPDKRHGPLVESIAGTGCMAGETIYGAPIVAPAGAAVVFSIEAAEQGELTIQESTDGASWLPTSDPAVFLVTASERGAVCLTPTAAGRYFRPAFKAYRAASRVWCLAQNWAA